MATILVCLAVLWILETDSRTFVTDVDMTKVYHHLCANERGSAEYIIENVGRTFGEYTTLLQKRLGAKAHTERLQFTRYTYALWLNVLHIIRPHPKKRVKNSMTTSLRITPNVERLFELVKYDLFSILNTFCSRTPND